MGAGRHMNEPSAVAAVRAAVAAIPPAERTFSSILKRLTRAGYPIGKERIRRIVEEYGLFDLPHPPPGQVIALADFKQHANKAAQDLREAAPPDTLATLERVVGALLMKAEAALRDVEIETVQQIELVTRAAADLLKVMGVAREVLAEREKKEPCAKRFFTRESLEATWGRASRGEDGPEPSADELLAKYARGYTDSHKPEAA